MGSVCQRRYMISSVWPRLGLWMQILHLTKNEFPLIKSTLAALANALACRQKLYQRVGCATLAAGEREKAEN